MQLIMRMKMGNVLNRQNSDQRTEKKQTKSKIGSKDCIQRKTGTLWQMRKDICKTPKSFIIAIFVYTILIKITFIFVHVLYNFTINDMLHLYKKEQFCWVSIFETFLDTVHYASCYDDSRISQCWSFPSYVRLS